MLVFIWLGGPEWIAMIFHNVVRILYRKCFESGGDLFQCVGIKKRNVQDSIETSKSDHLDNDSPSEKNTVRREKNGSFE